MEQASGYSESSPEVFPIRRPFCGRCVELRSSKNYCPICEGCYEDDDFDSKMIECGKCEEWVHSQCEGLSDEWYEILSLLPDSVEFLCKLCLKEEMPLWKEAIKTELVKSLTSIVNILITLESARHMLFLERKVTNRQALSNSALKEKKVGNEIMQKNGGLPSRILDFGQSVSSANDSPSKNSNSNFDQLSANMFSAPVFDIDGFNCSLKDPQIYSSEYLSKTDSKLVSSTLPSNAENQNSNVPDKIDIASYSRALFNENNESFLSNVDLYNTDFQLNKLDVACSSDLKGNRSATESSLCLLNSSDDESDLKKIDKNSPYSLVAKVSKDIDDDCLSSDGSWCDRSDENSDSEIESLVDVFDDVNGLKDIKDKVAEDKYRSVTQFHIDVLRVFESGTLKNELSTQITKEVYLKLLKNNFSWFKPESMDIFPLIDSFHPFPMPYFDHSYSSSKRDSWYGCGLVPSRSPLSLNSSPTKSSGYLKKDLLSPNKWSFTTNSDVFSPTKSERFDCSPLKMVDSKRFLPTASNKVQPSQDRVVDSRKCVLCNVSADSDPNDEGRLLYLGQDEWLHVNCALWSSEVYEEDDGGLQNVYVALSRGRQIRCASCNERGATIGCCFKTCQLAFHFSCARRNGCFFGEDKGIFCSSHLASAKDSCPTSDFRVERCVFVNMDSEKRKWKKIPKDNIKVIIGSLTITELGSISSNVDCNDALIPINFSCTRMYWSTKNPTKKVKYTCRIKRNNSVRKAVVPDVFHKTVNHSLASNIVEEQLEQIKIWHKDVKERELAEQTKETNIVPPHMCPMYCEILLKEYLGSNRINPKLSYSLQSVIISSDIVLEQSDLLKLRENPKSLNISNSSQSPLCESNELLENFVSEEDGKIISMVLKEMDSLSVSTALPSLNRISPVIFESLSNGDDILNCSDEELLSDQEKRDTAESFPIRPNTPTSVQDVNLVETTDAKDNSSAQIENEIGSEEVNSDSTTSPSLIQQNALDSNSNTENSNPENVPAKETSVIFLDEDSQNNQLLVELPLQINGEDTAVSPECSRSDPNDMQKISIPSNAFDKNNDPNSVVPDVSGVSQVSDSSNERAEQNNDESQTVIAQISQELEQTVVKEDENCIQSEVLASELPSTNPSPNKPIKGVDQSFPLKMGNLRVNLCPLKKEMLLSEPVLIRPDFGNKGVCENRNCSSASPKVKRRKICKVKPILSEESRKKTRSISCEDQHLNSSSIPCEQNQPLNSETPLSLQTPKGRRLLRSGSHHRRSSKLKRSLKSKRIQMKRNYKTVIKKYPLRSAIKKNTPIETVQIEINETLELPSDDDDVCIEKLKRKWCSKIMESKSINTNLFQSSVKKTPKRRGHSKVTSEDKEENIEAEEGQSSSVKTRSHQVVSFSDDRSGITVSITNNNLCDLAESRKRKKFRHKKIYQLDGAADGTSSDDSSMEVNLIPDYMKSHHSDLAMRIKQQSLARSCPSEEGPYKCSKCKRLYRTKESYSRHIETCTFEVDSSSSSDEDENLSANEPRSAVNQRTNVDKQSADSIIQAPTNSSNVIASSYIEGIGQAVAKIGDEVITLPEGGSNANSSLQKLQKMCHQQVNVEDIKGNYTVHRQIRIGMKKPAGTKIISDSDKLMDMDFIPDKSESDEVFVPSKFVPTVKKSESPRKYTNVKLFKGKQGFQYRRALPQSPIVAKSSAQQIPQIIPDMQCGRLQGSSSQNVVNLPTQMNQNTFPVQSTINSLGTYQSHQIAQLNPDLTSMSQVMTVVSNQSVVVPQGYALQYVGSYKDEGSSSNVLTYPSHQPMIITPPMMVAPQPTPVVMNQILNTNIAFTVGASDTIVLKQPAGFLPNVQYMNTQHQSYIQSVNSGYPIEQNQNQVSFETRPASSCSIANSNVIPQENFLQQNNAFKTNLNLPPKVDLSPSPQRNKPQAHIAPIMKGDVDASSSKPAASAPSILRPFQQMTSATRSVATIAPAIFSTTSPITSFKGIEKTYENRNRSHTSVKDAKSDNVLTWSSRPRPTYSYRDAMKIFPTENPSSVDSRESVGESKLTTDEDSDSGKENVDKNSTESKTDDSDEQVQSYKLILKKDQSTDAKFNILPVSVPKKPLASPEIKELRIKAKVSVGPTRKKQGSSPKNNFEQLGKDFFVASKNILNDLYVNEQVANVTSNSFQMPSGDSKLIDKSKILSPEPHIVFEVTSEDGFKVESEHVSDVWRKVYEAVSEARESLKMGKCSENAGADGAPMKENKFSGLHMLGLTHNAVQYLLEQLPGSKDCHKYSFQFHRRPADELHSECASGCARTEPFKARSPYDIFSWLASKHRRLPFKARPCTDDITFSTRRATSMDLPMAMRYRYLSVTAREAVGVFRSEIHGRGLFCKREIDAGEMVIEYAGQLIRSGLCDMREKFYESKGIGCYMFRIDEETVIDATMHGNAARFINHACDPNCYSRVVDILGKKHIIIFALRRIQRGEELTYDYKFPIEDDKIACSCGARRCRKYLN